MQRARIGVSIGVATLLVAGMVSACGQEEPVGPEVSSQLIQPEDLPQQPGSIKVGIEASALASYSRGSTCGGYDEVVLTHSGWETEEEVAYYDVGGRTIRSSVLTDGSDARAALAAVAAEVAHCTASAAADVGYQNAIVALPLGDDAVGFQSNSREGVRQGQRGYLIVDSRIVQVTVVQEQADPKRDPVDLAQLLQRAKKRLN